MELEQAESELPPSTAKPDDTIYVGKKSLMSYVLAVVTKFNQGASYVNLKARGKSISTAVDVSQVVKSRFVSTLKIALGDITTEELASEDGTMRRVSSLTLTLTK